MSRESITRRGPMRNPAEALSRLQTLEHDRRPAVYGSTILSMSCKCKCNNRHGPFQQLQLYSLRACENSRHALPPGAAAPGSG